VVDFIEELNKKVVPQSYTFKDQGRKKDADPSRKGVMLLPGQYKYQTFVDDLKNKRCCTSFKGSKRFSGPGIAGLIDKVNHTIRNLLHYLKRTSVFDHIYLLLGFVCK
jgi:hypothetical protein